MKISRLFQISFFSFTWIICGGIVMAYISFVASLFGYFVSETFLSFIGDIIDGLECEQLREDELSSFTFLLYPIVVFASLVIYFIAGPVLYAIINSVGDTKKYLEDVYYDLKNGSETLWYC